MTAPLVHRGSAWQPDEGPVRIGSLPTNSIVVAGPGVAPVHAVVVSAPDGRWLLRDLNTSGGLWVDGRRVPEVVIDRALRCALGAVDGPSLDLNVGPLTATSLSTSPPAAGRPVPPTLPPMSSAPPSVRAPGPPAAPPPRPAPAARFGRIGGTPSIAASVPMRPAPAPAPAAPRAPVAPSPLPPSPSPVSGPPAAPASPATTPTTTPTPTPTTTPTPPSAAPAAPRSVITIGRAADRDVVVRDLLVARHHAELRWNGTGWDLLDLGSPTGVVVDGVRRGTGPVRTGQRLTFGTKSFVVGPDGLQPVPATAALGGAGAAPALAARNIVVEVDGGTRILDQISIEVEQGQLVAIVGPSGSGKSTLLKAMTGSRRPEGGSVQIRGVDLYEAYDELCRTIGYVPQDDILHLPLTIRQALTFGAELRFPADTTEDDRRERVDEVLAELELAHRADVPVEKVSGGQRKRTSVALELLTRPELLFLDEPTSGLDPGFERTVMELLRELASAGRAVVVVTHSLQSLELCDKVLFLAPGGHIAFFGHPDAALAWFERDDFIDVFRDLEALPGDHWSTKRGDTVPRTPILPTGAPPAALRALPPAQPWKRQVEILVRRQVAILRADRQNLLFLAGGVIVPAVLILLLMGSDTLRTGQDEPVGARNILSAVVVAAVAIGAANSIREIVKELPIYLRERSVGLQRSAYLTSKLLVVGALTTAQAAVLVIIATLRSGGPGRANLLLIPHLELIFDVALTGLAAVGLGLLLSTLVSSSEKAMALVPVVFVVMWLFSGAALDLQAKPVMRDVAKLTAANWGMAAASSSVGEHELSQSCSAADVGGASTDRYDDDDYDDDFDDDFGGDPYGVDPSAAQRRAERDAEREAEEAADAKADEARREAIGTCDRRWEQGIGPWMVSILALLVLTVVPVALADRRLALKEPLEAQRANDWPFPWLTDDRAPGAGS